MMAAVLFVVVLLHAGLMGKGFCVPAGAEQDDSNAGPTKDFSFAIGVSPDDVSLKGAFELLHTLEYLFKLHAKGQLENENVSNSQHQENVSSKSHSSYNDDQNAWSQNMSRKGHQDDSFSHDQQRPNISSKGYQNDAFSHKNDYMSSKGHQNDSFHHQNDMSHDYMSDMSHDDMGDGHQMDLSVSEQKTT